METWATGWLIALGVGLFKVCALFSNLKSIRAKNLVLIDAFYNPWTATHTATKPMSGASGWAFVIWVLVIGPLFSWLSVVSFAVALVINWHKQSAIPEKVKEINYRLANIVLTEEEVRAIDAEYRTFSTGKPVAPTPALVNLPEVADVFGDGNCLDLDLSDKDSHSVFSIRRSTKTFEWSSGPSDRASTNYTTGEYKIEENGHVFMRTIDYRYEGYGKTEMRIQDGVVCQDNVRKSFAGSFFADDIEERLADLLDMTKWREFVLADVRWSVVGAHPEVVAPGDWRRLMREDVERLRRAATLAHAYANKKGCNLAEDEFGYGFHLHELQAMVEIDLAAFTEDVLRLAFGATLRELKNAKSSIKTLEKYLETLSKAA